MGEDRNEVLKELGEWFRKASPTELEGLEMETLQRLIDEGEAGTPEVKAWIETLQKRAKSKH